MNLPIYQLMYVSTASWPLNTDELSAILDVSRAKNQRANVTGLLLHIDQGFLQILEGPEAAVMEIFRPIERDRRHFGIRVLVQQHVAERLFGGWSMGFDRWTRGEPRTADMFKITADAIENAISPEKAAALAVLLRSFYRINTGGGAATGR
ncbi:BLUF domain-containing protein [Rhizomicrobium electricum]|jgi:hypothetical protein|uniref:BLUF domain-containing protein n=1 Tax=Rhizomicrobium electricum TaxID=480070 RepID=A0ABP3P112_9PROT|nr:BLUF domain-containing protein [Rhizomicrobium electricum]NIJ47410.1 hypothetical protein [Rhizomicrobium electricum]